MQQYFTMSEACTVLGISRATLGRRLKSGGASRKKFKRGVTRLLSRADLKLDDAVPIAAPNVSLPYQDSDHLEQIAPVVHPAPTEDDSFATLYKMGLVPDSAGNYITGHNERWSESVSLLGPVAPVPYVKPDHQAHMNKNLEATAALHAPVVSVPDKLAPGLSAEAYSQMMNQWRRDHHGADRLSMSEQRAAQARARANIHRSFPRP